MEKVTDEHATSARDIQGKEEKVQIDENGVWMNEAQ